MATVNDIQFSPGSIEFRDEFQDRVTQRLRELVASKVRRDQRTLITESDVRACMREAFEDVMRELRVNEPHKSAR